MPTGIVRSLYYLVGELGRRLYKIKAAKVDRPADSYILSALIGSGALVIGRQITIFRKGERRAGKLCRDGFGQESRDRVAVSPRCRTGTVLHSSTNVPYRGPWRSRCITDSPCW